MLLALLRASAALADLPARQPVCQALLLPAALVIVISSLVMVYLALMLTNERSEAQLHEMHLPAALPGRRSIALTRVPNRRHFHELAARARLKAWRRRAR